MGILEKIKQKPEKQKKFISLTTAIILTLIIVVIWLSYGRATNSQAGVEKVDKLSSISPWQMIKEEFSKAFNGYDEALNEIMATTSTSTEEFINASSSTTTITSVPIEIINEASTTSTSTENGLPE